jgi:hypothetical protein
LPDFAINVRKTRPQKEKEFAEAAERVFDCFYKHDERDIDKDKTQKQIYIFDTKTSTKVEMKNRIKTEKFHLRGSVSQMQVGLCTFLNATVCSWNPHWMRHRVTCHTNYLVIFHKVPHKIHIFASTPQRENVLPPNGKTGYTRSYTLRSKRSKKNCQVEKERLQ